MKFWIYPWERRRNLKNREQYAFCIFLSILKVGVGLCFFFYSEFTYGIKLFLAKLLYNIVIGLMDDQSVFSDNWS